MTGPEPKRDADEMPADLLPVLRAAAILPEAHLEQIRARVLRGELPIEPPLLARRLVKDGVLSEYQAGRLLRNKPQGLSFGKYIILDKLGSGAMGRVYQARHLLMGRDVALKIINPEVATNRRLVGRFRREMHLVGRLDHPHVVRAYDADHVGSTLFIVMEFVPGESLGQRLRQTGPLPARDVIQYAAQAARGLGHAHAQGIVHRDVKPTNILLGSDGRVRVLDLGLGVLLEPDAQHGGFMTADGLTVGTVDYMSPEQATGKDIDGRSDLFALGCTMFHLISGQHAFDGPTKVDRMLRRLEGAPRSLDELVSDLPPGLTDVMGRLMVREPAARYASGEKAAEALESLLVPKRRAAPSRAASSPPAPPAPAPSPAAVRGPEAPAAPQPLAGKPPIASAAADPAEVSTPAWLQPLVELSDARPGLALAIVLGVLSACFLAGLLIGMAIR